MEEEHYTIVHDEECHSGHWSRVLAVMLPGMVRAPAMDSVCLYICMFVCVCLCLCSHACGESCPSNPPRSHQSLI